MGICGSSDAGPPVPQAPPKVFCPHLLQNDVLRTGDSILSEGKSFTVTLDDVGVLSVTPSAGGPPAWSSPKDGGFPRPPFRVQLMGDGNLQLLNSWDKIIWMTESAGIGTGPYSLSLADDGVLSLLDSEPSTVWSSTKGNRPGEASTLRNGSSLPNGGPLFSPSGEIALTLNRESGAISVRDQKTNEEVWSRPGEAWTFGPYELHLSMEGNLRVWSVPDVTNSRSTRWETGTGGKGVAPYKLCVRDRGALELVDSKDTVLWSAGRPKFVPVKAPEVGPNPATPAPADPQPGTPSPDQPSPEEPHPAPAPPGPLERALLEVTDTLPQGWALFAGYFLKCRQSDRKFEFLVSATSVSLRVVDGNGVELWTTGRISPDGRYPYRLDWSPQGDLVVLDMDDKEFWRINVRQDYGFVQPLRLVFQSNSLELKDSAWRTIWGANIPDPVIKPPIPEPKPDPVLPPEPKPSPTPEPTPTPAPVPATPDPTPAVPTPTPDPVVNPSVPVADTLAWEQDLPQSGYLSTASGTKLVLVEEVVTAGVMIGMRMVRKLLRIVSADNRVLWETQVMRPNMSRGAHMLHWHTVRNLEQLQVVMMEDINHSVYSIPFTGGRAPYKLQLSDPATLSILDRDGLQVWSNNTTSTFAGFSAKSQLGSQDQILTNQFLLAPDGGRVTLQPHRVTGSDGATLFGAKLVATYADDPDNPSWTQESKCELKEEADCRLYWNEAQRSLEIATIGAGTPQVLWSLKMLRGQSPFRLQAEPSGVLKIYDSASVVLWSNVPTRPPSNPGVIVVPHRPDTLPQDTPLETLVTNGGQLKLVMDRSSVFVRYTGGGVNEIWWTAIKLAQQDPNMKAIVTKDGNFIITGTQGAVLWQSNSGGGSRGPYKLRLEPKGEVKVYDGEWKEVWKASPTIPQRPPPKQPPRKLLPKPPVVVGVFSPEPQESAWHHDAQDPGLQAFAKFQADRARALLMEKIQYGNVPGFLKGRSNGKVNARIDWSTMLRRFVQPTLAERSRGVRLVKLLDPGFGSAQADSIQGEWKSGDGFMGSPFEIASFQVPSPKRPVGAFVKRTQDWKPPAVVAIHPTFTGNVSPVKCVWNNQTAPGQQPASLFVPVYSKVDWKRVVPLDNVLYVPSTVKMGEEQADRPMLGVLPQCVVIVKQALYRERVFNPFAINPTSWSYFEHDCTMWIAENIKQFPSFLKCDVALADPVKAQKTKWPFPYWQVEVDLIYMGRTIHRTSDPRSGYLVLTLDASQDPPPRTVNTGPKPPKPVAPPAVGRYVPPPSPPPEVGVITGSSTMGQRDVGQPISTVLTVPIPPLQVTLLGKTLVFPVQFKGEISAEPLSAAVNYVGSAEVDLIAFKVVVDPLEIAVSKGDGFKLKFGLPKADTSNAIQKVLGLKPADMEALKDIIKLYENTTIIVANQEGDDETLGMYVDGFNIYASFKLSEIYPFSLIHQQFSNTPLKLDEKTMSVGLGIGKSNMFVGGQLTLNIDIGKVFTFNSMALNLQSTGSVNKIAGEIQFTAKLSNSENDWLVCRGGVEVESGVSNGKVTIWGAMDAKDGSWDNPFGIPGISIVGFGIGISATTTIPWVAAGVRGEAHFGGGLVGGSIALLIDPSDPSATIFDFKSPEGLQLPKLIKALTADAPWADGVSGALDINITDLQLSFSPRGGSIAGSPSYPMGLAFGGALNLMGWTCAVNGSFSTSGGKLSGYFDAITVPSKNPFLKLTASSNDPKGAGKGPSVDLTLLPTEVGARISARAEIPGVGYGDIFGGIGSDGVELKLTGPAWGIASGASFSLRTSGLMEISYDNKVSLSFEVAKQQFDLFCNLQFFIRLDLDAFTQKVYLKFSACGKDFELGPLQYNIPLKTVTEIEKYAEDVVKKEVESFVTGQILDEIGKGTDEAISWVEDTWAQINPEQFAGLLIQAGAPLLDVVKRTAAKYNKSLDQAVGDCKLTAEASVQLLTDGLGYSQQQVEVWVKDVSGFSDDVQKVILKTGAEAEDALNEAGADIEQKAKDTGKDIKDGWDKVTGGKMPW